ncbi:MAG TPA: hypothetical protein DCZ92_00835 [Elusimicrobia bacterium]|nr:MAG: hypothetical protein A2016_04535 [Elusimicrobia bacterium GWF2_62_30]HBA59371.1 hypothetical protein [Elusimicrobiota bacterium]
MIADLLGHKDYIRVLQALRSGGRLRFGRLETLLGLNPVQVDRALKFLREGAYINAQARPSERRKGQFEYSLARRGEAFLEAFQAFAGELYQKRGELGPSAVAEFRALYQPEAPGAPRPGAVIDRVIKIRPLEENEPAAAENYRAACLRLSPKERIARMRAHSRRMILLNPANPRSPHIDRSAIRIIHDAF